MEIRTPRAILFGIGAAGKLTERMAEFPTGPMLMVTDSGLVKAGVVEQIRRLVLNSGRDVRVFDGVLPDPDQKCVRECLAQAQTADARILLGIGGGSCLDVAKMVSVLLVNGGQVGDYVGINKVPKRGLPTILIPTTAGTGSEVSPIAVISDKQQHLKLGIVSPHLYGDLAMVDPALTVSCPAKITASAGMDALTHAIEIYTNKFSAPLIDTFMLEAIHLIGRHLSRCVHQGQDLAARSGMSLAALYAGLGLGPVNTAAVHALAYPLGATFDIPHGLANSVLLPYVMEFNSPACREKFAAMAESLGLAGTAGVEEKASAAVRMVVELSRDVGIPRGLRDINVPREAIPQMAASAAKVTRLLNNNPRAMSVQDIQAIYERAY